MLYQFLNFLLSITILIIPTLTLAIILFKFRDEFKSSKFYIFGMLILGIIFLNKLLFSGQTLAAQDFNNIQITFNSFFSESFKNHLTPPIWYTKIGGGLDAFSNPIAVYFSPFNFLYLIFSNIYYATNIFILFQIIFLSVTAFLLFRGFNYSKAISFFAAIAFTYNGFLIMRLSPGVGVEYLYTYKWIPLILLFTNRIFVEKKYDEILFLGICLGFTFEGNPNIAFGTWCFWFLFLLISIGKNFFKTWKLFLTAIMFGICFYSIKLIPGIDMMYSSSGRISRIAGGWRTSRMKLYEFIEYFIPLTHKFMTPTFTPGVIVIFFSIVGFLFLAFSYLKNRTLNYLDKFALFSFLIGCFLNTDNPLSEFFYSLPIFNRFTVTPTYLSFLLIPLIYFAVNGLKLIMQKFLNLKVSNLATVIISLLVFLEITLGPSTFGNKTFSFNFAKMNLNEVYSYQHYKELSKNDSGLFLFNSNNNTFMYPYGIQLNNLYTFNSYKYFYENFDSDDLDIANLNTKKMYANTIVDLNTISDSELNLVSTIKMKNFMDSGFESHAINERRSEFFGIANWNRNLNVYKVNTKTTSIKNISNHPFEYKFNINGENFYEGKLLTSISFSNWWKVTNQKNVELKFDKNYLGLIEIQNVNPGDTLELKYFNPLIYIGMLVTLISFGIFLKFNFRKL